MAKGKMKGVTCIERNGSVYGYARTDGHRVYCGQGDKGKKLAEAGRAKYVGKQYENREMNAGLKIKKVEFKTIKDLSNWYMQLPTVQAKKGYYRKVNATGHLLRYFGNKPLHSAEGDDQEHYRNQFVIKGDKNPRRLITDSEFEALVGHADPDFRDVLVSLCL